MNLNLNFRDCNNQLLVGRKVLFTPTKAPEISASLMSVKDSYTFTTDTNGDISASVVASLYQVDIANPTPATSFYVLSSETGSVVYSGSIQSGSVQCVFFDLILFQKDWFNVKTVKLTPQLSYPSKFSGSLIALASTSSKTDATGSVTFSSLVPGPYLVDCIGKVDTSFYISVPTWYNTGSTAPCWNAKDLLIVKPSKGIKVKVNNLDTSYVLTVSSSDARYAPKYSFATSSVAVSSSTALYANTASIALTSYTASYVLSAVSSSYSETASYALNVSAESSVSASWASASLSASHALYADVAGVGITTNLQDSASWASSSLSSSWAATASYALNATAGSSISSSWASASLFAGFASSSLSASWASASLTARTASYIATASYALYALTSSNTVYVAVASVALLAVSASISDKAIHADTASILDPNSVIETPSINSASLYGQTSIGNVTVKRALYLDQYEVLKASTMTDYDLFKASNIAMNISESQMLIHSGSGALSSSYAATASLSLGSTLATNAVSASWASSSVSASFAASVDSTSPIYIGRNAGNVDGKIYLWSWEGGNYITMSVNDVGILVTNLEANWLTVANAINAQGGITSSFRGFKGDGAHITNITASNINGVIAFAKSASWASQSFNAVTSSFADKARTAEYSTQSTYATNSLNAVQSQYATQSISSSFATVAVTVQNAPKILSASWASSSISSSLAQQAVVTDIGNGNIEYSVVFRSGNELQTNGGGTSLFSFNPGTNTFKAGTVLGDLTGKATLATSASWASSSFSSSWASSSIASRFATQSLYASQSLYATNSLASVQSQYATQSTYATNSLNTVQAQYSTQSLYATNSLVSVSSSWASQSFNAVSASYAYDSTLAQDALFALASDVAYNALHTGSASQTVEDGWTINNGQLTIDLTQKFMNVLGNIRLTNGNLYGTASWATSSFFASSASWASSSISSSYALNTLSASYAPGSPTISCSFADVAALAYAINFLPQYAASASWASSSLTSTSASHAAFATSASYASASNSSSYAQTASWARGITFTPPTASYAFTASILAGGLERFSVTSSVETASFSATVASSVTGSYLGAFYDYICTSASLNQRIGTVFGTWLPNTNTIEYTEYSTVNIGNTDQISMSMDISASVVRLRSTVPGAVGSWTIKCISRYI